MEPLRNTAEPPSQHGKYRHNPFSGHLTLIQTPLDILSKYFDEPTRACSATLKACYFYSAAIYRYRFNRLHSLPYPPGQERMKFRINFPFLVFTNDLVQDVTVEECRRQSLDIVANFFTECGENLPGTGVTCAWYSKTP